MHAGCEIDRHADDFGSVWPSGRAKRGATREQQEGDTSVCVCVCDRYTYERFQTVKLKNRTPSIDSEGRRDLNDIDLTARANLLHLFSHHNNYTLTHTGVRV